MARATATGLELSFVPSLKQWRKRIDGKTFYLGKGDGIDDSESYGRALAKWRQIQEQGEAKAETQAKVEIAAKAIAAPIVKAKEQSEPQSITALVIDEFLQEQETKFQRGQRMISAPKGTRISSNRLLTVRYHIKSFREVVGSLTWKKDEAFAALLIKTFRNHYESALLKNKISPRYFNDLIGFSRQFVQWAYDNYKLDSLPRNMKALCSKYELQSTAKAMSVEHINTLWKIANSRERLYIALGLNLGYYSSDIATLKSEHVKGDYIIRERNKTGVPSKHKLWDVTKKLL
ncbi:MAG: hypothetical protein NTW19_07990 [Planctomycetota bacterium]|nr:hypothetical protein [Planctomycetota bacterium]